MPRTDSKPYGSQFYHTQFDDDDNSAANSEYAMSSSSPRSSSADTSANGTPTPSQTSPSAPVPKKKHVCPTCERAFTTSGHLARHSRVHTGERNHKCPFPGCETRCSRQDNLQQHYRIHLSPGSRRSSTRSAIARAMNQPSSKRASSAAASHPSMSIDVPPLSCPPALEPARVYQQRPSPPNSPPPLAQATMTPNQYPSHPHSRAPSSSPQASYTSNLPHMPLSPVPTMGNDKAQSYNNYIYQHESSSHSPEFTFVHSSASSVNGDRDSYGYNSQQYDNHNNVPHINTSIASAHESSPISSGSSRHSISHISHPHPPPRSSSGHGTAPPSPASSRSVSSHASGGPPTPTNYGSYHDESQASSSYGGNGGSMIAEQPAMPTGHSGHMGSHIDYASTVAAGGPGVQRFDSPPPILAPIHDTRRVVSHHERHEYHHQPYVHPAYSTPYHHQSMGMNGHHPASAWKPNHSDIRSKGVGALVR